jgi:hypothetical protein
MLGHYYGPAPTSAELGFFYRRPPKPSGGFCGPGNVVREFEAAMKSVNLNVCDKCSGDLYFCGEARLHTANGLIRCPKKRASHSADCVCFCHSIPMYHNYPCCDRAEEPPAPVKHA